MDTDCTPNDCPQPEGACCVPNGSCTVTTEADCTGTWSGIGTDCTPNDCPQPDGACCADDGSCTVTKEADCTGDWQGMDTDCSPNECPQPTGACCALDGTCAVTEEADCTGSDVYEGDDSVCSPNPCPQPDGACCADDGSCTIAKEADCTGDWQGMDTDCDPNLCPQPTGACCATDGGCTVTEEADCTGDSVWQGADTVCDPNPCPQPTGACCATDGGCTVTDEADCTGLNVWQGAETDCDPNLCPIPTGACCADDGSCTVTEDADCTGGSTWQGADTVCSPNPCPQPTGACCAEDGGCTVTEESDCTGGSTWQGADTVCDPNPCPQPTGACCTALGVCTVTTSGDCADDWQGADTVCSPNPCTPPTITVSPTTVPTATLNEAYSQTFTASGGSSPYVYEVSAGSLPAGLSLATNGSLTGTPTSSGDHTFTVQATDDNDFTGNREYTLTVAATTFDMEVTAVYITQATQRMDFGVPLVKDRDGLLRAFVVANESNSETPDVRVRIYNAADALVQTYTISAPGSSVGTSTNEGTLTSTWNQLIPGTYLQPGYSILVDVDPTGAVPESNESNNNWPVSGTPSDLDVRDLSRLQMTLVPVSAPLGTGGVNSGNAATFMDYTRRIQPIPDYDVTVRASLSSSTTLLSNGGGWETMLNEVTVQRTADASSDYYYGVVHVNYSSGVAGLGWVGYPVAIGWDYLPSGSWVLAHEIGHNFDRIHTACSGESGTDPDYPYSSGYIGVYGYDLWASTQKDKNSYRDIMSYCNPQWTSDYTYEAVLSYRETSPYDRPAAARGGSEEPCLLVWGTRRDGVVKMEPSLQLTTRPVYPEPGEYRVEGLDASGAVVWSQSFEMMAITHMPEPDAAGFNFAVPMSQDLLDQIVTLRVMEGSTEKAKHETQSASQGQLFRQMTTPAELTPRADGTLDVSWDASRAPIVMVWDLDRDECVGIGRNGFTQVSVSDRRYELRFSDGVHTRIETWDGR
ncbi:MAG: putative Ig domain-containing protein [Candidatus Eisenbacteria bacterium]|uniref:Ig domain-containing protein n=1 Tax=Eiseniibacteriota bacterium TaxID=2212470 RepID=A0A956NGP8_UNCEI|nr:putative Ig domain-containing protein [Candidatus Eisenbacteria bacterium]